eukprot:m.188879 g.188879  ORF g.188879 m.188879 type:complete len:70 (-) comp16734_c1_seq2:3312-3521(-)
MRHAPANAVGLFLSQQVYAQTLLGLIKLKKPLVYVENQKPTKTNKDYMIKNKYVQRQGKQRLDLPTITR